MRSGFCIWLLLDKINFFGCVFFKFGVVVVWLFGNVRVVSYYRVFVREGWNRV